MNIYFMAIIPTILQGLQLVGIAAIVYLLVRILNRLNQMRP